LNDTLVTHVIMLSPLFASGFIFLSLFESCSLFITTHSPLSIDLSFAMFLFGTMLAMDRETFDVLVQEAVSDLPPFFRQKMENVAIIVEDEPSYELAAKYPGRILLGLYHGIHPQNRSVWGLRTQPDFIYIFQRNIERIAHTEEAIKQQVRKTVMHEIGHYFGLDEAELRELGL